MPWPKGKPRKTGIKGKAGKMDWKSEKHHGVTFSTRHAGKKNEDIAPNVLFPKPGPRAPIDIRPTSIRMMEMLLQRKLRMAEKIAAEYQTRVQVYAELLEALERL